MFYIVFALLSFPLLASDAIKCLERAVSMTFVYKYKALLAEGAKCEEISKESREAMMDSVQTKMDLFERSKRYFKSDKILGVHYASLDPFADSSKTYTQKDVCAHLKRDEHKSLGGGAARCQGYLNVLDAAADLNLHKSDFHTACSKIRPFVSKLFSEESKCDEAALLKDPPGEEIAPAEGPRPTVRRTQGTHQDEVAPAKVKLNGPQGKSTSRQ